MGVTIDGGFYKLWTENGVDQVTVGLLKGRLKASDYGEAILGTAAGEENNSSPTKCPPNTRIDRLQAFFNSDGYIVDLGYTCSGEGADAVKRLCPNSPYDSASTLLNMGLVNSAYGLVKKRKIAGVEFGNFVKWCRPDDVDGKTFFKNQNAIVTAMSATCGDSDSGFALRSFNVNALKVK